MADKTNPVQVSNQKVTRLEEGIAYEYSINNQVADVRDPRYLFLFPGGYPTPHLVRNNLASGKREPVFQDVGPSGSVSKGITKITTDGVDIYILFDDSNQTKQIGRLRRWYVGIYAIEFVDLGKKGCDKTIEDLIIEGGQIFVKGKCEGFDHPMYFGLRGLSGHARAAPGGPGW